MKILTIATTNPLFIVIQYKTINKFIKCNEDVEFIVFNDSKDWPDITNFNDITIKKQKKFEIFVEYRATRKFPRIKFLIPFLNFAPTLYATRLAS